MEHQIQTKSNNMYLITVILLMFVLPLSSILVELSFTNSSLPIMNLTGKWFLFWAVGMRLFTAGIRQAVNPAFTAKDIFHLTTQESYVIVKELGFANICLGLVAILSLFVPPSRLIAACAGGLFFGIAGTTHLLKKPVSSNEWIAMISDIFISVVMLVFILFCFWTSYIAE
ncbi:DUF6790 family protein [Spirosoma endbachense]|uniref:DUF4345 domain-containing protein n=1 Tax=Spirosoma endbachense TaxID=2666025 RepID=A0A6P1VTQ6_9BACT|nr:DUF6790 family protein [Spirosoma endbachense]QHV95117.1 hypothetical protein GJR95_08845 [Spirosoma endbachense]